MIYQFFFLSPLSHVLNPLTPVLVVEFWRVQTEQRDSESLLLVCRKLVWGSLLVSPYSRQLEFTCEASEGGASLHRPRKVRALDNYLF